MNARWWNGRVQLSDGRWVIAHLVEECAEQGWCGCGFCKGHEECEFGDCRNPLPAQGAGTLCLDCSSYAWRVALPGHRASVVVDR